MGRVINLRQDSHDEFQALLPWYAAGRLGPAEAAGLQAHLDGCADCQAELRAELRLVEGMAAPNVTPAPGFDVEQGWRRMRRLMEVETRQRSPLAEAERSFATWRRKAAARWRSPAPWLGWALVTQSCLLLVLGAGLVWQTTQPARYRALGSVPANSAGNIVVIFRPDTREGDLRAILRSSHARLADGPTAADAYLVAAPAAERPEALAALRRRPEVVMAEPVDAKGRE